MDHRFGPSVDATGTTFRLYAPSATAPQLILPERAPIALKKAADGFWTTRVKGIGEGARYRFRANGLDFPDLAARQQDGGTNGWSVVRKPFAPSGRQQPISPWQEAIFCEVHAGTVTPEGTFAALANHLEHFRDAGYTTLELMPVASFPGTRNWGYDGTLLFAPAEAYGTPDDLKALIDRAHALKLCIVLDVVYNHFGDVDNFASAYVPEWFSESVETPWGAGINFENPMVRQFYYENACMWLAEYDFDGLRFDAVHEIKTDAGHAFLRELAQVARTEKPSAKLIVENVNNKPSLLVRDAANEPVLYTAQWNDQIHHVIQYLVTGERKNGYEDESRDPIPDLEKALRDGLYAAGEENGHRADAETADLPPEAFVGFVQNHDQIGNRPDGKRLADRISAEKLDFVHFLAMLAPHLPLFFMGEEAHLRCTFNFFVDLPDGAGKAKRADREKQMKEMFHQDAAYGTVTDPNAPEAFEHSKLAWAEFAEPERQAALNRFRQLSGWRRELVWPLLKTKCLKSVSSRHDQCITVTWEFEAGWLTLALNPSDWPHDIPCVIRALPSTTGWFDQNGETLRLGAWSAVAWAVQR
jgi:malto-oligosyltrehalose trehalohydrolase